MSKPMLVYGYCYHFFGGETFEEKWRAGLKILAGRAKWVRTYGMGGAENVGAITHEMGFKIATGAWLSTDLSANEHELELLISAAKRGEVDLAIIGSETLFRNDLTGAELTEYLRRFKEEVPNVPVMTCDVEEKLFAHPEVMEVCDIVGLHIYPYWHGISLAKSMEYVSAWHRKLSGFSGKEVLITETGWPSGGDTRGEAVASPGNAKWYFDDFIGWAHKRGVRYFYFEAFDEAWKAQFEGPQGATWGRWKEDGTEK